MDLIKRLLVHPVTWETMRFGVLFTSAEVTQQILVKRVFNKDDRPATDASATYLDWGSVFRYSVWGFLIFPHVLRRWYRVLDKTFHGHGWREVIFKTATDQIFFPMPILSAFYVFLSFMEGKTESWSSLTYECRVKLPTTLAARYCFMLPAQFVNFAMVSPGHRVIYVGFTTFIWLNVLCMLKGLDVDNEIFRWIKDKRN